MAPIAEEKIASLKAELEMLRAENRYLRQELAKKQTRLLDLEDVSLTLAERQCLVTKKLHATL